MTHLFQHRTPPPIEATFLLREVTLLHSALEFVLQLELYPLDVPDLEYTLEWTPESSQSCGWATAFTSLPYDRLPACVLDTLRAVELRVKSFIMPTRCYTQGTRFLEQSYGNVGASLSAERREDAECLSTIA